MQTVFSGRAVYSLLTVYTDIVFLFLLMITCWCPHHHQWAFNMWPESFCFFHLTAIFRGEYVSARYTLGPLMHLLCKRTSGDYWNGFSTGRISFFSPNHQTPHGAGVPPFLSFSSLIHSLPHLLIFFTISLFLLLVRFTYSLLSPIHSLSTRIVTTPFLGRRL